MQDLHSRAVHKASPAPSAMQRTVRLSVLHATRRASTSSLLSASQSRAGAVRALATQQSQRPVLPPPLEIQVGDSYKLKYVDLKPPPSATTSDASPTPTIVFIHGSPGTYEDFKYLLPLLQHQARVVGINLPGNGDSQVLDTTNYYDRIRAIDLAHAAQEALATICAGDEHVFVVGHSFGGHATINVTALNERQTDASRKIHVRGLALLASAGLRIHLALEQGNLPLLYTLLQSKWGLVEALGRYLTRFQYTHVWGFPTRVSTEQYVAGLVRCASTDFAVVNDHAAEIAHLPSFFAWAKDDAYIQQEIFQELSLACRPGPRFAFEKGGHNIQKTKAEFLAAELLQWTQAVIEGDTDAYTHDIVTRP